MILLQRTLYCVGLLLWLLCVALHPTWVGRSYSPDDPRNPGIWSEDGVFGLQGADGVRKWAPVWSPPRAHSSVIATSVRWPWQRPNQYHHVELSLSSIASRLSVGLLVLGLILRGANWISRPREPDLLVSVAWSVSLSLVIAWLCIVAIVAFTCGYGATDSVIATILAFGTVAGLIYGIATSWHCRSRSTTTAALTGRVIQESSQTGTTTITTARRVQAPRIGSGLFWFTIGIVSACCLTMAGGWLASFFRGPIVGHTVLGTPRFARDQTPVNMTAGLGILATGWIFGLLMLRFRIPRALLVGLIVGTTILGIVFTLWK
jgi:hypothetical protein